MKDRLYILTDIHRETLDKMLGEIPATIGTGVESPNLRLKVWDLLLHVETLDIQVHYFSVFSGL